MNAKELLLSSLDERMAAYGEKLKARRDDFSAGAVHDLRTSIRRLLAVQEIVGFMTSKARVEKLSERLKDQLDGVDGLRDIQVMLDSISKNLEKLPELEPFEEYLKKREKRQKRAAEKYVEGIKPKSIEKRVEKIRQDLDELPVQELDEKLPQAVDQAYLTVVQRYGQIDPDDLLSIHHLRVAFKKFRYMVEAIHPCLPGFPEAQLERMHRYQTQMGNIQDTRVFLERLEKFAAKDDSYDPAAVRRFYERALADALSAYLSDNDEVLTFWRATPLEAFPWEGSQSKKEE